MASEVASGCRSSVEKDLSHPCFRWACLLRKSFGQTSQGVGAELPRGTVGDPLEAIGSIDPVVILP